MASSIHIPVLFLSLLFYLVPPSSPSPRIPTVIAFGDSFLDSGNNNYILTIGKANFRPYGRDFPGGRPTGRFSNGRLVTDLISKALSLPATVPAYLDPAFSIDDFAVGVCFASGGSGLDNMTSQILSVISLRQQVDFFKEYKMKLTSYLGDVQAQYILNEALFVVSIGTNDFILNYFSKVTPRSKQFTVAEYIDFLISVAADFLTGMHSLGARKILFLGLPPLGCLPLERTIRLQVKGQCVEEYNKAARDFNTKLQAMFQQLNTSLPGMRLRYAPVYDLASNAIQNPQLYGFENVEEGCCGTGEFELGFLCNRLTPFTCENADKYMFWDSVHPTQKFYDLVTSLTVALTSDLI